VTNTWHRFQDTDEGDDRCDRCACVVSLEAHMTFTLPCPVPACTSKSNPDAGCLFAPGKAGVATCVYCGHSGTREGDAPPSDPELDAVIADLMVGDDL
jgi:hypothetical protein